MALALRRPPVDHAPAGGTSPALSTTATTATVAATGAAAAKAGATRSGATAADAGRSLRRGAAWLTLSTVLVGLVNYAFSLSLTWLLPVAAYSVFAMGQALLLVGGTVAGSSSPWVLSQQIAAAPGDDHLRREAVSFSVLVSLLQGMLAAAVVTAVAARISSGAVLPVLAGGTLLGFAAATSVGYFQGYQRFRAIVGVRIAEVVGKAGAGLLLAVRGLGAPGALAGFSIGSLAVVAMGVLAMRHDLRLRVSSLRATRLWRQAGALAGIQGGVALLANVDVILAGVLGATGPALASYQVSMVLARIPLFLSVALSTVVFPKLSSGRDAPASVIRSSWEVFLRTVIPLAAVIATVPRALVTFAFPAQYAQVEALLPYTAATGALVGVVNLVTTYFQAQRRFARCTAVLFGALAFHVAAIVFGLRVAGVPGLALGTLTGAVVVAGALLVEGAREWPDAFRVGWGALLGCAAAFPLVLAEGEPRLWVPLALATGAWAAWTGFLRPGPRPGPRSESEHVPASADGPAAGRRLRILHLAFEDHLRPGSGGGAVRTREVNRRLAERHDVTVVCAKYRGCRERVEDGVRYVHVGLPWGYFPSLLAYFAALPLVLRRYRSDLVVEDFAAPFSSLAVPWWTRRPVVGVVQWLFAREKSRQYKLPFHLVERLGVRSHRRLVAVSEDLAAELRRRNPRAEVTAVLNGLEPEAFLPRSHPRADLVFLGRVEFAQKGLDLLVEAFAKVADRTDVRLLVAGDGPDTEALRARLGELGLENRIELVGRVNGADRFDLLAGAQLVCMPSRYETFGMVAAEAMAVGTPVLAFDIPCLRGLVTTETGVTVEPFDTDAYAENLAALANDPEQCRRLGEAGPAAVAHLRWDSLAEAQEQVYLEEVGEAGADAGDAGNQAGPDTGHQAGPGAEHPAEAHAGPAGTEEGATETLPQDSGPVLGDALGRLGARRARRQGRLPRVLALGNFGSGNTGDEAILARLVELARGRAELTVVSRSPEDVTALHGVPAVRTLSRESALAFLRADALSIGGGGIFGKGLPPLVALLPLVAIVARLLGKDTGYLAIGAYPDMPRWVAALLRLSGRLSRAVSVREAESQAAFTGRWLGRRQAPPVVQDPAIGLTPAPAPEAVRVLAAAGVNLAAAPLVISLKPTPDLQLNEVAVGAMAEAADWWTAHHPGDVVLVALSVQGDYGLGLAHADAVLADRVRARMARPDRLKVVGPRLHPALAKAVVARAARVIGLRLHAQIFAWSTGRPLLGLSFEAKSDAFLRQVGADRLALAEATGERIVKWLKTPVDPAENSNGGMSSVPTSSARLSPGETTEGMMRL